MAVAPGAAAIFFGGNCGGTEQESMESPYDIASVASTYRTANIRQDDYVAGHFDLVALNLNHLLRSQGAVGALDVGCGAGGAFRVVSDRLVKGPGVGSLRYTGIDASRQQIEFARADFLEHDGLKFQQGPADALPFEDAAFDLVFECRLFQFLTAPETALREMWRVSRGLLVATVFTMEADHPGFHPFFTTFETDENNALVKGGAELRELNLSELHKGLMGTSEDKPNLHQYIFARHKRRLMSHASLDAFIEESGAAVLYRNVATRKLDGLVDREGDNGVTDAKDRYEALMPRWQTLVLARN